MRQPLTFTVAAGSGRIQDAGATRSRDQFLCFPFSSGPAVGLSPAPGRAVCAAGLWETLISLSREAAIDPEAPRLLSERAQWANARNGDF